MWTWVSLSFNYLTHIRTILLNVEWVEKLEENDIFLTIQKLWNEIKVMIKFFKSNDQMSNITSRRTRSQFQNQVGFQ